MRRPRLVLSCLLGSAILVGFAIASVPWSEPLRRPRTPFEYTEARSVSPGFALLEAARSVIPAGASVVARTEPPNAVQETYFHRFAISLLPQCRVFPAAFYGGFVLPEVWKDAEYMVIVGPRPAQAPGRLVLETPDGTVWMRGKS